MGALLFTAEGYWLIGEDCDQVYLGFVFLSTMLVYSTHRIIGIRKLAEVSDQGRFQIISQYRHHLIIYIFLSLAGLLWLAPKIPTSTLLYLVPLGIISVLYTLPLLGGVRLRDFHYIKILLIACVWSGLALHPILLQQGLSFSSLLIFLEKVCFMIAITIPFDIRDVNIDGGLKTIPKMIGVEKAYRMSFLLLAIGGLCLLLLIFIEEGFANFGVGWWISIGLAYLITVAVLKISKNKTSDYYYSGLIDGTLVIRGLILGAFSLLG